MAVLANLYAQLGRHHDALPLYESALRMRRRVLPPNHSYIGIMHFVVAFTPFITRISQETPCMELPLHTGISTGIKNP
jgi:hypothetical protein